MAHLHVLLMLAWIAVYHVASAQALRSHTFRPSSADPGIVDFDNFQYAYVGETAVVRRDKLVVFLPGTGGTPFFYREFLRYSATLGFHSLGLMYPNARSVGGLCAIQDRQNPDCPRDVRLEIIDGSDRTNLVQVDRGNSIENRLTMAITYLEETYPSQSWAQFLDQDNDILWDRIVICGHSQGGGHAALIAKRRVVDRCLVFAAADWFPFGDRLADWASEPSATPAHDMYVFGHERDPLVPWDHVLPLARACDLDRFGQPASVDRAPQNLRERHILITNTSDTSNFHNSVVVDPHTPRDEVSGALLFQSVWHHMLLADTPILSFERLEAASVNLYWQTGTLQESTDLVGWADRPAADSPLKIPLSEVDSRIFFRVIP